MTSKYTWKWIIDPDQVGVTTAGWDSIDRMDVSSDGLKATVHFKEAYAGYYGLFATSFLPEHWMKTIPIKDAASKSYPLTPDIAKSPTNGPFKYDNATSDTIVLVRNDDWKAGDHPAYLDKVTFHYYPDNKEGVIAAFLTGDVDVALDLVQTDYDAIKGVDPTFGRALLAPAWLYEHLDLNQMGQGQGHGHPALKDPVVRQAIAQAIDRKAMFETVFPGAPAGSDLGLHQRRPDQLLATPGRQGELPELRRRRRQRWRSTQRATPRARMGSGSTRSRSSRSSSSTARRTPGSGRWAATSWPSPSSRSGSSSTSTTSTRRRSSSRTGRTSPPTRSATPTTARTTRPSSATR